MNPSSSPYQPPKANDLECMEAGARKRRVKVFGIFHTIFGSLGILLAVALAVLTIRILQMWRELGDPSTAETPEIESVLANLHSLTTQQLDIYRWLIVCVGIPAVIMLVAGILLLRKKKAGPLWSNLYAISSILAKAAMASHFYSLLRGEGMPWGASLANSSLTMIGCAYAILALLLLNRQGVKEALSVRAPRPTS